MKDFLISVYGWLLTIIMLYVSGWLLFLKPLVDLVMCETLTGGFLVVVFLKLFFALPVANLIMNLSTVIAIKVFMR